MIPLFISLALFISLFLISEKYEEGILFLTLLSFVLSGIIIGLGFYSYPNLLAKGKEAEVMESKTESVRAAYYSENMPSSNPLVAGSLANIKQSTVLSEHIRRTAELKANYAATVARTQYYQSNLLYRLFWIGCFIPEEIHDIEIEKIDGNR